MNVWPKEELEHLTRCPVCSGDERQVLYANLTDMIFRCAPGSWTLWRCNGCGCAYLDPRPNAQSIARAYTRYYTHHRDEGRAKGVATLKAFIKRARMYAAHDYLNHQYGYKLRPALLGGCLLTALPSFARFAEISIRHLPIATSHSCTLLDVGCGDGNFLLEAERLGYKAVGLEPDEMAVKNANRKGLVVKAGRLPASELPYNSFSHVTMSHVVEHLHDPCEALREVYMLMQPQGRLWLATPNLNTIQHYKSWALAYHLDPPRHLVLFDSDALRVTLQKAGFTSIQIVAPRPDETRIFQSMAGATNVFSPLQDRTVVCSAANEEHTLDQQDKQGEELFAVAYKD